VSFALGSFRWTRGKRRTNSPIAIVPSRRARGAPRQKWIAFAECNVILQLARDVEPVQIHELHGIAVGGGQNNETGVPGSITVPPRFVSFIAPRKVACTGPS
jgi:hypothetical protein